MSLEPYSDDERAILDAYHSMDEVEKLIFLGGLNALRTGRFTVDEFEVWVSERLDRHRAGEDLTVGDLEIPEAAA
ncbi:hypothetical protein [Paracoccus sp. DMF]|uniref:hypothetical protein n=1 Tax=Paracoccus sp. DMF TaxID=400837 RepID=UPI0011021461|nr:hypothetical protein [Paracoccus sp. DMF]MCV2446671.1 hypothetical protein [Paracoccus sp. DMF]